MTELMAETAEAELSKDYSVFIVFGGGAETLQLHNIPLTSADLNTLTTTGNSAVTVHDRCGTMHTIYRQFIIRMEIYEEPQ